MKKKILSFIFAVFIMLPCVFAISACAPQAPPPPEEPTNAELAVIYKEVADRTWAKAGLDNPTESASLTSATIDLKQETTDLHALANIKNNANNVAGILYMLSLLYQNENFYTTNDIAKFDATVTMFGQTYEQGFTLSSSVDLENNKLYLESVSEVGGIEQYSRFEANYNFEEKELISFRFCSSIGADAFVDMELTADNKNMWYETEDATSEYSVWFIAKKADFVASANAVEKLTANFNTEIQTYFTMLEEQINSGR